MMKSRSIGILVGVLGVSTLVLAGCNSKSSAAANKVLTNNNTTKSGNASTKQSQNKTSRKAPSPTYTLYTNSRFGFSVRVPSTYTKLPAPQDHDGASWTSKNSIKITSYGQNNVLNQTVASALNRLSKNQHPSYQQTGTDWLVISGINKSNQIYYTKMYVGKNKEYALTIKYPKSQKSQDSKLVTTVANSFKPGPITPVPNYSAYTNQTYHFSLKYPSNWTKGARPKNGDGRAFYVATSDKSFSNKALSFLGLPKHDAVIQVVGTYNPTQATYSSVKKRPQGSSIRSYKVSKVAKGYKILETQQKGTALWYTVQFFNKNYFNTLTIIIPSNSSHYKAIAQKVIQSFKFTP